MPQTYQYSVSSDFPAGKVRGDLLQKQIAAEAGIQQAVQHVSTAGDACSVVFSAALDAPGEAALDALVAAHDPGTGVIPAKNFFKRTLREGTTLPETDEWYEGYNSGTGAFSGLAERTSYSYTEAHALLQRTVLTYTSDGVVWAEVRYTYYTSPDGHRIVKMEELL